MNKAELVEKVATKTKLAKKDVAEVVNGLMASVQKAVGKGQKVSLIGFGTFEPRKRAARIGRNPATGKELKIAAKTVPAFKAGKKFKELLSK